MKRFLLCLSGLTLIAAALLGPLPPGRVEAQSPTYIQQQTIIASFNITAGATATVTNINANIGQVGHSLQYRWNSTSFCTADFDGSHDGTHWSTLAALPVNGTANAVQFSYANGYFTQLRLKVNPGAVAACSGSVLNVQYAGFQIPLPYAPIYSVVVDQSNVTSPQPELSTVGVIPSDYLIAGIQCYNPNNATAFLEAFDASTSPTLGTNPVYEIGIPQTSTFILPSTSSFVGTKRFWLGAATTATGSTAVATALPCSIQFSTNGPFYPLAPDGGT